MNYKKTETEKPTIYKNKSINKLNKYCWTYGRTRNIEHTNPTHNRKKEGHQVGATLENKMGGRVKYCKEYGTNE